MRILPLELVHAEYQIGPLWHGHRLGFAKKHQWPKNKGKRKQLEKPNKIVVYTQKLFKTIPSRKLPSFSPYKSIHGLKKKKDLIWGLQLLWASFVAMFGFNFVVASSEPRSLNLCETSNLHFKLSFLSLPNYRSPLFLSLIGSISFTPSFPFFRPPGFNVTPLLIISTSWFPLK